MGLVWKIVLLGIGFTLAYFLLYPVFILMILITILVATTKIMYPLYKRHQTPHGMRINHKLLKGYLTEKYGSEGKGIYKEFVDRLRKRGYY